MNYRKYYGLSLATGERFTYSYGGLSTSAEDFIEAIARLNSTYKTYGIIYWIAPLVEQTD